MLEAVGRATRAPARWPPSRATGWRARPAPRNRVDASCGRYDGYTASFVGLRAGRRAAAGRAGRAAEPEERATSAGQVAAPVFKEVMTFAMKSQKIPPTGATPVARGADARGTVTRRRYARGPCAPRRSMRPTTSPPRRADRRWRRLLRRRLRHAAARRRRTLVTGVTIDSRPVRPGDLYVAAAGRQRPRRRLRRRGRRRGRRRRPDRPGGPRGRRRHRPAGPRRAAIRAPCSGQVAAWVYGRPAADARAASASPAPTARPPPRTCWRPGCGPRATRTGLIGTRGDPRRRRRACRARAPRPEAHRPARRCSPLMRERGVTAAAMEVSSHALALGRVDGVVFDVARVHQPVPGPPRLPPDLDDYFAAKARLFTRELQPRGRGQHRRRVRPRAARRGQGPGDHLLRRGHAGADWRAVDVGCGADGSTLPRGRPRRRRGGRAGLAARPVQRRQRPRRDRRAGRGRGAAADRRRTASARCPGCPAGWSGSTRASRSWPSSTTRTSPTRCESVLRALRAVTAGRLIVVLGCGGDRDRASAR